MRTLATHAWYHGSPNHDLVLDHRILFLTPSYTVAEAYAHSRVAFTSKRTPGKQVIPTIYELSMRGGMGSMHILDLRTTAHGSLYNETRLVLNKLPAFADDNRLPKLDSAGFIQSRTGLPGYGQASNFKSAFGKDFDAVWLDEGSQGISLAVFDPVKSLVITKVQILP